MIHQQPNVPPPHPQRRDLDHHHRNPVVQILPKTPLPHRPPESRSWRPMAGSHLCLKECPYPHRCPACGVCVETPGPCRECRAARQLLPPRPLGRGLDALRKEVGLDG
jgi:hypothetical protein